MSDSSKDWTDQELDSVAQALQDASIPLQTTDPDESLDDLEPLRDRLSDATIIGMGEHSHGTREVFQFKHRLFRFLVTELDYRVFVLESEFAATLAINEYVLEGEGTAQDALSTAGVHEHWECAAVLDLVEWVRSFNEEHPDDKIRFFGADAYFTGPQSLAMYLQAVDPTGYNEFRNDFEYLMNNPIDPNSEGNDYDTLAETYQTLGSTLSERFTEHEQEYIGRSSNAAFELAKRQVELLERSGKMGEAAASQDRETVGQIRSEIITENVEWVLEFASADNIAVWAHNNHVNRGVMGDGRWSDIPAMGELLTQSEAYTYVSLGFSVAEESVRIFSVEDGEFEAKKRPEAPVGSLPDVLSRTEYDYAFVDLQSLPGNGVLDDWLSSNPGRDHLAARYQDEPAVYLETDPRDEFDALVFIREGTAARAINK